MSAWEGSKMQEAAQDSARRVPQGGWIAPTPIVARPSVGRRSTAVRLSRADLCVLIGAPRDAVIEVFGDGTGEDTMLVKWEEK